MNGIIVSMQEEVESEEEGGVFMDLSTMKETRDLEVHVHVLRVRVDLETMLPCIVAVLRGHCNYMYMYVYFAGSTQILGMQLTLTNHTLRMCCPANTCTCRYTVLGVYLCYIHRCT